MENNESPSSDALMTDLCSKVESYLTDVLPEDSKAYDFEFSDHSVIGEYIAKALKNIADTSDIAMTKDDLDLIIESAINGFRKAWCRKYPNCTFGDLLLKQRKEELYKIAFLSLVNANKDLPLQDTVAPEISAVHENMKQTLS